MDLRYSFYKYRGFTIIRKVVVMKTSFKSVAFETFKLLLLFFICSFGAAYSQILKTDPGPGEPVAECPTMRVGDSWTISTHKGIVNKKVFKVNSDGSYVIEWQRERDKKSWRRSYDKNCRPIKSKRNNLEFPLYVNKKWKDKYRSKSIRGDYFTYENFYTVTKYEQIKTKVGSFKAFKIKKKQYIVSELRTGKPMYNSYWYVPQLKTVVKYTFANQKDDELVSYNLQQIDKKASYINTKSALYKNEKNESKARIDNNKSTKKNLSGEISNIQGARWAVVIGISKYKDTRIPSLRYAENDAISFYNWLISSSGGQYAPSRVKLLAGKDATGKNIKSALFNWLGQVIEEDIVTIFFAGHGSAQGPDNPENLFLLPFDAQYDRIATTGFPMWDIETALTRFIKAKKVIVITDACHAGGVGKSFDIARRGERAVNVAPISTGLQNLSTISDGICIISGSDDNQLSQESKNWGGGHGVFTFYLLEGLNGNADYNQDNKVSLGEIIPYLSENVRRATKSIQTPTIAGRFDPALTIGK